MRLVLMSAERNADLDPVPLTLHVVICAKKPRVCSVVVFFLLFFTHCVRACVCIVCLVNSDGRSSDTETVMVCSVKDGA